MIQGKKILIGISGSIAAYKSILLVRLLVKLGADVKVIMTPAAVEFVSPLTLSTLSKHPVLIDLAGENTWANHVMLGRWADVMIIAPASCNTLAKMTSGLCDNLLLAAYLSCTCPVVIAPAMDEDMWRHFSTQENIRKLERAGQKVITVNKGELASGLFGEGRMAEPEEILQFLKEHIFRGNALKGKRALVTAGPTYEAIDPVRFIGNHSSGKMGIAIAEALYDFGADVELVQGPVQASTTYRNVKVTPVVTAQEMFDAVMQSLEEADIIVMAAAVADFTPGTVAEQKIKKTSDQLTIDLVKTKDILQSAGAIKKDNQLLVGFALETDNEQENALKKLSAKNADMIVLNSLRHEGAGFGIDTNKVTIFDKEENSYTFEVKSKQLVARDIVELIIQKLNAKT
jgi:phosphopantothenoylcysteine decarboxylase / phosphopantothenate---cysteine ligase